ERPLADIPWTSASGGWTRKVLALLGTDHDKVIARTIGRTRSAVKAERLRRRLPPFSGWSGHGPAWTAEHVAPLGTDTDAAVAKKIGRTRRAVSQKRAALGVRVPRPAT